MRRRVHGPAPVSCRRALGAGVSAALLAMLLSAVGIPVAWTATVAPTPIEATASAGPLDPSPSGTPPGPSGSATGTPTGSPEPTSEPSASPTGTSGSAGRETPPAPSPSASIGPSSSPSRSALPAPGLVPARRDSGISSTSVVLALLVLVAAGLVLRAVFWRVGGEPVAQGPPVAALSPPRDGVTSTTDPGPDGVSVTTEPEPGDSTILFLVALGEAMIDSSAPVTQVTSSLRAVAEVNGKESAELIVLSTALMVSVHDGRSVQTAVAAAGQSRLRLEQVDAVFDVVSAAERGDVGPDEGLRRLDAARSMPATFGTRARVLGYIVMTVGLALVLKASWTGLLLAGVLGAGVACLQLVSERVSSTFQAFLPVASSFLVSLVVLLVARTGLDVGVFAPLVAPLVTLLPGALLTTSVIELSTGQMISGAGRLAAGAMQLVLLALGIVAAAQLVGVPATTLVDAAAQPLGPVAPWLGVAVFGAGVVVNQCARPASAGWIMLVLYVAYAGQVIGGLLFGALLSGFVGAVLMTPVAMLVATRPSGPYPFVSFLPSFWLLVPGALGLVGVTKILGDDRIDGTSSLVTTGVTMVGIALGVLLGLATGTALATAVTRRRSRRAAAAPGGHEA